MQTKKLAVISLGCDKNRVDTENMLSQLCGGSFVISPESEAQIIIINTCAFIESARKEAIDTILRTAALKAQNLEKLIVTGCLPQKYLNDLQHQLPEVDAFLGINDYDKINKIIHNLYSLNLPQEGTQAGRVLTTPYNYAYLKISDGCNNHCTYCTIPSIRGKYRSVPIENLVKEAELLVDKGVKEIILVAQDVTNYGIDLYGQRRLVDLIIALSQTDARWIRLMYCYPDLIDDALIDQIATNDKVVKYLDIPLQHIDDRILRLMGRHASSQQIKNLINKLRAKIPDIALRSTFIAGFPSETEQEFLNLKQFIKEYKFNHAGFFAYSLEKDTPSAKIKPFVPKKIAKARVKELFKAQQDVVLQFNKAAVGKVFKVMYQGIDYDKGLFYGRPYFCAPEVDTLVYFTADFADFGQFYSVKITASIGYDLLGKVEEE